MPNFYVTFGQKWRTEKHPNGGHPDGYMLVETDNHESARLAAQAVYPYANVATEAGFDSKFYPKGQLGHIATYADGSVTVRMP